MSWLYSAHFCCQWHVVTEGNCVWDTWRITFKVLKPNSILKYSFFHYAFSQLCNLFYAVQRHNILLHGDQRCMWHVEGHEQSSSAGRDNHHPWANEEAMAGELVSVLSSLDMTFYKWYKLTSVFTGHGMGFVIKPPLNGVWWLRTTLYETLGVSPSKFWFNDFIYLHIGLTKRPSVTIGT